VAELGFEWDRWRQGVYTEKLEKREGRRINGRSYTLLLASHQSRMLHHK